MNRFYKKPSADKMKERREEYKKIYSEEMSWFKENMGMIKGDKFLLEMYAILVSGGRPMSEKMIGAVRKAMINPKYDPIKRIKQKEKMQPILEKINLVWEMVAEIDEGKNDYYLANYSALPFVNSIKEQATNNLKISEKQLKALNKVYTRYKKIFDNKNKK